MRPVVISTVRKGTYLKKTLRITKTQAEKVLGCHVHDCSNQRVTQGRDLMLFLEIGKEGGMRRGEVRTFAIIEEGIQIN